MTRHAPLCKYRPPLVKSEPATASGVVRFEFLLCFTRHLIRHTVSYDALTLAVGSAQDDCKATDEEVKTLLKAVFQERDANGIWPKGF
jgi:hypothetical protein